jgi:hypothetical protein
MQTSLQPVWWKRVPLLGIMLVGVVAAWVFDPPSKPVGAHAGRIESFFPVHKDMDPSRSRARVELDSGHVVQADLLAAHPLKVGDRVSLISYQSLVFHQISYEGKPASRGGP